MEGENQLTKGCDLQGHDQDIFDEFSPPQPFVFRKDVLLYIATS
jgi:hypothetical protein